jgi:hypothetical protein
MIGPFISEKISKNVLDMYVLYDIGAKNDGK